MCQVVVVPPVVFLHRRGEGSTRRRHGNCWNSIEAATSCTVSNCNKQSLQQQLFPVYLSLYSVALLLSPDHVKYLTQVLRFVLRANSNSNFIQRTGWQERTPEAIARGSFRRSRSRQYSRARVMQCAVFDIAHLTLQVDELRQVPSRTRTRSASLVVAFAYRIIMAFVNNTCTCMLYGPDIGITCKREPEEAQKHVHLHAPLSLSVHETHNATVCRNVRSTQQYPYFQPSRTSIEITMQVARRAPAMIPPTIGVYSASGEGHASRAVNHLARCARFLGPTLPSLRSCGSCSATWNRASAECPSSTNTLARPLGRLHRVRAAPRRSRGKSVSGFAGSGGSEGLEVLRVGVRPLTSGPRCARADGDISTCNAAMKEWGGCARWQEALALLNDVWAKGITAPNAESYRVVIAACGDASRWREAVALVRQMAEKGVVADERCYTEAIKACDRGQQCEKALGLFNEMGMMGVTQSVTSFNAAITACGNGGQWQKALSLLRKMQQLGKQAPHVAPDITSYNAAFAACQKSGASGQAVALLREMKEVYGIAPNDQSYSFVIKACGRSGRQWEMVRLLLH